MDKMVLAMETGLRNAKETLAVWIVMRMELIAEEDVQCIE